MEAGGAAAGLVCRSCLEEREEQEMRPLFGSEAGAEATMLVASAAISLLEGDGLPAHICSQCATLLLQTYTFKTMCERADARLRSVVGAPLRLRDSSTQTGDNVAFQLYNCSDCQKKFKSLAGLQKHKRRHTLEADVAACDSCGNLYPGTEALHRHVASEHGEETDVKGTGSARWMDRCDDDNDNAAAFTIKADELKMEPGERGVVRVKEEPVDVYHDEDDVHSDYLPPVKEEYHGGHIEYRRTSLDTTKRKVSKKKSKKTHGDMTSLPEHHPCALCPRVFASKGHLEAHEAKHAARTQRYSCLTCGKSFSRSSHLKRHHLTHSGDGDTLNCLRCANPEELEEKHICGKSHNTDSAKNPKVAFCNLCDRGFTTQRYLEIHMRSHRTGQEGSQGVEGFPCKACDHVSENKADARVHTQWHRRAERPFLCSECGQGFTRDAYLTVHMRRHRGEKPFSCSYCGKGFPRRSDLDIHERYHTEDKRHTCTICGKAFHRQYNLKVHLRVHTGERPYACPYCPKAFTQPNDLKAHVRRHTGERFTCELCSAQFLHGYHLTQHRRAVHAVDKPSHIRRLSKFPSAGPPHPPTQPPPPPTRGRARQAHIQLAAHMASILAQTQQQQQQPGMPGASLSLPLSQPPPAS